MEEEIWKPVLDYEECYEVSSLGRIRSLTRVIRGLKGYYTIYGRLIRTHINPKNKYVVVRLSKNGIKETFTVHVLVARHFKENPDNLPEVDHDNFDRTDNRASNLRWSTRVDNIRHSSMAGRMPGAKGNKSPCAKHTNESVLKIRELYSSGEFTQDEIAQKFGVKRHNISKIILRQRWSHI